MPLPHFLLMLAAVILAAATTIWVSLANGVSVVAVALVALIGAGVAHLAWTDDQPH
ncbi:hypothetical protein [Paracoccus jeotgali]|uniref:hypothetical protein n=1 Tax=Paracoccus jeotgali TaxID=2065379 RepID=UPI001863C8B7|nr:hypothetical protein [Paracoccus jeotgali]